MQRELSPRNHDRRKRRATSITAMCALLALTQCRKSEAEAAVWPTPNLEVGKLALLVGVGDYPGSAPSDLAGPANDVALVATILRERFGFPADNIVTLVDAQATHASIVRGFREHLIRHARAGTEIVFWFSGHGSRIPDASKREEEDLDNTLVAWDSREKSPNGGYDISDDEVHTMLQQLALITDRIVIVTDSCHSGSSARSEGDEPAPDGTRFTGRGRAPLDLALVEPLWGDVPILDDDASERRPIQDRFVHVGACASWQLAGEWNADGVPYGMLSWFLVRALERAEPNETWRNVVESVRLQTQSRRLSQTPTFDGNVDRKVFGGEFAAPPRGYPAEVLVGARGGTERELSIDAGEIHGLVVGSGLAVHALYDEEPLGHAEIVRLHASGMRAFAKWRERPDDLDPAQPLRVVEESRPITAPRLAVSAAERGLVERLGLGDWLREVEADQAAYELEPDAGDAGFSLRTAEGVAVWPFEESADVPNDRELVLRNSVRFRALERLPLQQGDFRVSARFVAPESGEEDRSLLEDYAGRIAEVRPWSSSADSQWRVELPQRGLGDDGKPLGDLTVLEVTNDSAEALHISVISLEESGHRRFAIWGHPGDETRLRPGDSMRVAIKLTRRAEWPLDRPMRDRYIVLATQANVDAKSLTSWKDSDLRSAAAPLPWVLNAAFAADTMRSETNQVAGPRRWGITSLDLHTK